MAPTNPPTSPNSPLTFSVTLAEDDDRLDCAWFNPTTENKINEMRRNKRKDRKLVQLKDIATIQGGKRLPKGTVIVESETNKIPYIRATDVKNQRLNFDTSIKIPKEIHQGIQSYQLKKGDIVITIVGTIGEIGFLDKKIEVCNFSENIARVRINEDSVLAKFILYFLGSEFGKMQVERFTVGSLQYKLSLANCRNLEIYIPHNGKEYDTKAQEKILAKVNQFYKRAEQRKKRGVDLIKQANAVITDILRIPIPDEEEGSLFAHNLGGEPASRLDVLSNNPFRKKLLSNLKKHSYKVLGDIIKIQNRASIGSKDFYKLVELEQIDEKTGRIVNVQEVLELGSDKKLLKSNSILIARLQPQKGKIVIVPPEYDGAVGSSEFIPIILETADVSLKYLWAVLRSNYVLKQWAYELTGSSRMRIGLTELKRTIIPTPSKAIQNKIVSSIESKIRDSDKMLKESARLHRESQKAFIDSVIN